MGLSTSSASSQSIDFAKLSSEYLQVCPTKSPKSSAWPVLSAVIIETVGKPAQISQLWDAIPTQFSAKDDQVMIARRIREALLKSSPLSGFPKGINCLGALKACIEKNSPEVAEVLLQDKSMRAELSATELEKRGYDFFGKVYAQHADRILDNMSKTSGGDLNLFACLSIYGELMAETRIVDAKDTGLLEFTACFVSGAAPQAKGHMFGSRNLGNKKADLKAAIQLAKDLAKAIDVDLDLSEMSFINKIDSWE